MATFQSSGGGGGGRGPFGRALGPIPLPDPYGNIQRTGVNLDVLNPAASADLEAGFAGRLAPGTVNSIQDAAATWGAASGMPGFSPGTLGFNRGVRDLGLTAEGVKDKAFQNYGSLINTIGQNEVVSPELEYERNLQNETNAASPDPAAAQSYAASLFDKYLQSLRSAGGGSYTPQPAHGALKSGLSLWGGGQTGPSGIFR